MDHEKFPVQGFEFMDEPLTEQQKQIIRDLARRKRGIAISDDWGAMSKWDAARMIESLQQEADVVNAAHS